MEHAEVTTPEIDGRFPLSLKWESDSSSLQVARNSERDLAGPLQGTGGEKEILPETSTA
jgi:hypothetical protein